VMGSGAMIYIRRCMKTGLGVYKLIGRMDSQTRRQHCDCISVLFFFRKFSRVSDEQNITDRSEMRSVYF
jgi:hypothetical protein